MMDNYGTHKTPTVKRWFERHPEYHLHFTPTSGSWLNQVERFFAEITEKRIRRGVFRSVAAWRRRSWSTWPLITRIPSRSCGPPTRI